MRCDWLTHAGFLVTSGVFGLAQIQVSTTQIAPLAAQIVGYDVVEVVRQAGHFAVSVERRHAERMVSVWRAAGRRIVRVHQVAHTVIATTVA